MIYPYKYDKQFEKYIGQFMRVFNGFQTKDGVTRDGTDNLKRVPVVYGNMSRIVASVLQKRGTFQNNRIPMMAVNLQSIEIDAERKKSHQHIDSMMQNTDKAFARLIGPPLNLNMELSIYASSTSELFSIVEQILLVFNPRVTIQVDNNVLNSDYISEISLESINKEIQYPMGTQEQVVMLSMNFKVPVRLRYPHETDAPIIKQIIANILTESAGEFEGDFLIDSFTIGELDDE